MTRAAKACLKRRFACSAPIGNGIGGYRQDPALHLLHTFKEVGDYNEAILLRDIPFRSVCEHHMAPITGVAHISYLPQGQVVGISKLAAWLIRSHAAFKFGSV